MRWYLLNLLLSDSRVKFLLGFVIVAVILAGILTLIELRLKRKKEKTIRKTTEPSLIEKLKRHMNSDKSPQEKLDFLNEVTKIYFKESYGTPLNAGYTFLIENFEKNRQKKELAFSKGMFEVYYSPKALTDTRLKTLADMLIDIETAKKKADEISRVLSFSEKMNRFFERLIDFLLEQKKIKAMNRKIKRIEKKKFAKRNKNIKVIYRGERVARKQEKVNARKLKRQKKIEFVRNKTLKVERKTQEEEKIKKSESEKKQKQILDAKVKLKAEREAKIRENKRRAERLKLERIPRREILLREKRKVKSFVEKIRLKNLGRKQRKKPEVKREVESQQSEIAKKKEFLEALRKMKLSRNERVKKSKNIIKKGMGEEKKKGDSSIVPY